ncbi:MAG: FxLYD domain-containing protein [Candidatus Thermoplasmatota archaeon]|nr:FxLYD domain-containing protein [Candidatus Thermoplasmatota archaeon]
MRKQLIIIGIIIILITVGLSGCNTNSGNIIIVRHNIDKQSWAITVSGTVKNIADNNVDYAEVTVKFYDSDNELLITKTTQIGYIGNGETKGFQVYYSSSDKYFSLYDHYTVSVWSRK